MYNNKHLIIVYYICKECVRLDNLVFPGACLGIKKRDRAKHGKIFNLKQKKILLLKSGVYP